MPCPAPVGATLVHGSRGRHECPRRSFKVVGIFVLVIGAIAGGYLGLLG